MAASILIIEDNQANIRIVELCLKARGHTLLMACDDETALRLAEEGHPDLIVMGVQLRDEAGLQLLKRIKQKEQLRSVPSLAISAHAMPGDREEILSAGFDAYVSKPVNTRQLPLIIDEMLQGGKAHGRQNPRG